MHEFELLLVLRNVTEYVLTLDDHVVLLQSEVLRVLQVDVPLEGFGGLRQFRKNFINILFVSELRRLIDCFRFNNWAIQNSGGADRNIWPLLGADWRLLLALHVYGSHNVERLWWRALHVREHYLVGVCLASVVGCLEVDIILSLGASRDRGRPQSISRCFGN